MSLTEKWWSEKWRRLAAQKMGASYRRSLAGAVKLKPEFLEVEPGLIKVKIRTGKAKAAFVRISWQALSGEIWERLLKDMGSQSLWLAGLLSGAIPPEAEEFFRARSALLLPDSLDSLESCCSVHGPGQFCRHTAYAHLYFAAEIEKDPFVLFHFRGRGRDALCVRLQKAPREQKVSPKEEELPAEAARRETVSGFWTSSGPLKGLAAKQLEGLPADDFADTLRTSPFHLKSENFQELLRRLYSISTAWSKHLQKEPESPR